MNLKPNLWTLFFLLAAGALIYTQMQPSAEPVQEVTAQATVAVSDSIPNRVAQQMIINYLQQFETVLNDPKTKIGKKTVLETTGVAAVPAYFKLEKNEIAEIFRHFGGAQVYAVLGLLPGAKGARDTIDLLLSDVEPDTTKTFLQGTFYDFATPCPPLCDE